MNFEQILQQSESFEQRNSIWYHLEDDQISYPDEGNEICYELEDSSFWFQHRNRCILSLAQKYLSKDQDFFDLGGGNGIVSSFLQQHGITCTLIEPGPNGVINAQKRGVRQVVCATLQNLPRQEGIMDAAGAFDVVEHISDDQDFVQQIAYFLKPGGTFISTVPAYQGLWSNEDVLAGHFRRYTKGSYQQLLEENGFEVMWSSYFFMPLIAPIFLVRSIPYRLGKKPVMPTLDEAQSDHQASGTIEKMLDKYWNWEWNKINRGGRLRTGSSLLMVARKKTT